LTTTETPSASDEQRIGRRIKPSRALMILAGVFVVGTLIFWWLGSLPDDPDFAIGRVVFGNTPALIVALFYVAIATFLAVMFYLFAQLALSWERGMWESRSGESATCSGVIVIGSSFWGCGDVRCLRSVP
jgi:hypothetical protein